MDAELAQVIQDALDRRAADSEKPRLPRRTPDANHPFASPVARYPRQRTYRDPTGESAIGNIKKERER